MENQLEITNLDQLKEIAKGDIISLPGFKADIPFNVRVKRVSMLSLVRCGTIPNSMLSAAEELFYGKKASKSVDMKQLTDVMFVMAESALIEPSIKTLKELGLNLTDEQLVALFNYTQEGLKSLEKFRTESEDNVSTNDKQELQNSSESSDKSN